MINLYINVHCIEESWAMSAPSKNYKPPVYRLFLDGDLLTERTWLWGNSLFVKEEIWAQLETNQTHHLFLQPVLFDDKQATFSIENLSSNTNQITINQQNQNSLSFQIN